MSIESVMLSNHLILCHPLLLLPSIVPSISLFKWVKWVSSSHQVAKVLEFQLQHQSFQWIFRVDFLWDGLVWSLCCPRDSPESSPALFDNECTFSCWLYCARSHQSCPTLCNPMDCSLPVSSVHEFSRQENWSGLPFPSSEDLPNPGIKPGSPALQAAFLPSEPPEKCPLSINFPIK